MMAFAAGKLPAAAGLIQQNGKNTSSGSSFLLNQGYGLPLAVDLG
ncbi:hypothetical protein [Thiopseudomonas denitrificans]|nr:hypothetical protein [Thiopseudomonas denitrificans]